MNSNSPVPNKSPSGLVNNMSWNSSSTGDSSIPPYVGNKNLHEENTELKIQLYNLKKCLYKYTGKEPHELVSQYELAFRCEELQAENDILRSKIYERDQLLQAEGEVIKKLQDEICNKKVETWNSGINSSEAVDDHESFRLKLQEREQQNEAVKQLQNEIVDLKSVLERMKVESEKKTTKICKLKDENRALRSQLQDKEQIICKNDNEIVKLQDELCILKTDMENGIKSNEEENEFEACGLDQKKEYNLKVLRGMTKKAMYFQEEVNKYKKIVEDLTKPICNQNTEGCNDTTESEIVQLKSQLSEKEEMIEQLNEELKKRTYNLQELVNKELWDKNREIEKLNKLCERRKKEIAYLQSREKRNGVYFSPMLCQEVQTSDEEPSHSGEDDLRRKLNLCLEEKQELLEKIAALEGTINSLERVVTQHSQNDSERSLINNLRLECEKRQKDLELVEKSRQDAYSACSLLTTRLEELASFLETLLCSDFSTMNAKRKEILRQAIERSREISKSFSISFAQDVSNMTSRLENISAPILPDCSEINLSFSGGDNEDEDVGFRRSESDMDRRKSIFNRMAKRRAFSSNHELLDIGTHMPDIVQRPNPVSFVTYLDATNELVFTSGRGSIDSLPPFSIDSQQEDTATIDTFGSTQDNLAFLGDRASFPDDRATIDSLYADRGTIDSVPEDRINDFSDTTEYRCRSRLPVTASSALVSLEEVDNKGGYESESEPWSEPDRNVSAQRIGIQDSARKSYRRSKQAAAHDTDSDAGRKDNTVTGRKFPDENCDRNSRRSNLISDGSPHRRQCGIAEGGQGASLLSYQCTSDVEMYKNCTRIIKQHLENIIKYSRKTNQTVDGEKMFSKLKTISDEFERLGFFCSKLLGHLEEFSSRCELLTNILDETQNKFERVMIDLKSTRLSHNSLVLEHEQSLQSIRELEHICEELRTKLDAAENKNGSLESCVQNLTEKCRQLESTECEDCSELVRKLQDSEDRISELTSSMPVVDELVAELTACRIKAEELAKQNKQYTDDLRISDKKVQQYTENIESLESQLKSKDEINQALLEENERNIQMQNLVSRLRKEVSELNVAIDSDHIILQEKDRVISELKNSAESQNRELQSIRQTLELQKTENESKIQYLERELENSDHSKKLKDAVISDLECKLEDTKEKLRNAECEISALKQQIERCDAENAEYRREYEKQLNEAQNLKVQHEKKMKELLSCIIKYRNEEEEKMSKHKELMARVDELRSKKNKWKRSTEEWKAMYEMTENEKNKIERRLQELRSEECHANCVCNTSHTNLNGSICGSDASLNSSSRFDFNRKSSTSKYSHRLSSRTVEEEDEEEELRRQLNFATLTTSHVILEWTRLANEKLRLQRELRRRDGALHCVHHLEEVKTELERRVKELEAANMELELRLNQLDMGKGMCSDVDITSGDESSAPSSPAKCAHYSDTTEASFSLTTDPFTYDKDRCSANGNWNTVSTMHSAIHQNNLDFVGRSSPSNPEFVGRVTPFVSENTTATSPDLGIGSDNGRQFSFEDNREGAASTELFKLEDENAMLKKELENTRKALEETLSKLTLLNKNKKQMEKAICKQIYKTNTILKKARINLEEDRVCEADAPLN